MSTTRIDESTSAPVHRSHPGWNGLNCAQCGTPLGPGQDHCSICGWSAQSADLSEAAGGGAASAGKKSVLEDIGECIAEYIGDFFGEMNCAQCGTPLGPDHKPCAVCGWAGQGAVPPEPEINCFNEEELAEAWDATHSATEPALVDSPAELKDVGLPAELKDSGSQAEPEVSGLLSEGTESAAKHIGKYPLIELVKRDEVSDLYCAYDPDALREVAVTQLHPDVAGFPGVRQRFAEATRAATKLFHPNIAVTYALGEDDETPYAVTELLEGQSLDRFAATHPDFTPVEMLGVFLDICDALHYAHEQGVIHGNLRPANVMVLPNGSVKLCGFGTLIGLTGDSRYGQNSDREVLRYLSPEQIDGDPVDCRTDVFSSGVMLYQLLTETLPFATDAIGKTAGPVPAVPAPLAQFLQHYPAELDGIMARALARHPDDRYISSAAMAADLCMVRYAFKRILISGYLEYARACIPRSELVSAREALDSLFKMESREARPLGTRSFAREVLDAFREIDGRLPGVNELMEEVQRRLEPQWAARSVESLRGQAERALAEDRLPEASRLVERALQIDRNDSGLLGVRDAIQDAHDRRHKAQQLLEEAESALQAHNLDESRSAVDEALRLEPQNAQAPYLLASLLRHQFPQGEESETYAGLEDAPPNRFGLHLPHQIPSALENLPWLRLKQALVNPKTLGIVAAIILILCLAAAARVHSRRNPKFRGAASLPAPAENISATTSEGNLQSLVPAALATNRVGTTAAATAPAKGPSLTIVTDLDCDWKMDGKLRGRLSQGRQEVVAVSTGRHNIEASTPDGVDQFRASVTVGKSEEKALQIQMNAVQQQRLAKLQADAEAEKQKQLEAEAAEKQRQAIAAEEAEKKRQADAEAERKRTADAEAAQKQALAELVRTQALAEAAQKQALAEAAQKEAAAELARKQALADAAQKRAAAEAEQKRIAVLQQSLWSDPATGLWWARHDNGSNLNWKQALDYCAKLTLAGFSEWRLPTMSELQSIFDPSVRGDYHLRREIQAPGGLSYWSNTREGSGQAWTFNFAGSRYAYQMEYRSDTRALCVRNRE